MHKLGDIQELKHLRDGGRWCLDGRKERRLKRLGCIELNSGGLWGDYFNTKGNK